MLLMLVVPLALLVGLALGGNPGKFKDVPLKLGGLAIAVFTFQLVLLRLPADLIQGWLGPALVATAALLLVFLLANRDLPGFKLLALGNLLNLLVMAANGGLMPVTPEHFMAAGRGLPGAQLGERIALGKNVLLAEGQAALGWLSDVVVLPAPLRFVISPGDLLLAAGLFWCVLATMQPRFSRAHSSSHALGA